MRPRSRGLTAAAIIVEGGVTPAAPAPRMDGPPALLASFRAGARWPASARNLSRWNQSGSAADDPPGRRARKTAGTGSTRASCLVHSVAQLQGSPLFGGRYHPGDRKILPAPAHIAAYKSGRPSIGPSRVSRPRSVGNRRRSRSAIATDRIAVRLSPRGTMCPNYSLPAPDVPAEAGRYERPENPG